MWCSAALTKVFAAYVEDDLGVVPPDLKAGEQLGEGAGEGVGGCDDAAETVELGADDVVLARAGDAGAVVDVSASGDAGERRIVRCIVEPGDELAVGGVGGADAEVEEVGGFPGL